MYGVQSVGGKGEAFTIPLDNEHLHVNIFSLITIGRI